MANLEKRMWATGAIPMGAPGGRNCERLDRLGDDEGRTRVTRVGSGDGVDGEGTDGVDSELIVLIGGEAGHGGGG